MAHVSANDHPVQKVPRTPKCARCRNHDFVVPLKGHAGKCQFLSCKCWKCSLITERTKIMATQRRLRKNQRGDIAIKEGLAGFASPPSATVTSKVCGKDTFQHATEHGAGLMSGANTSEDETTFMELDVAPVAVKDHFTKQIASVAGDGERDSRSSDAIYGARDAHTMDRSK